MPTLKKEKVTHAGYKYMLEFPGSFRIYTNDDTLLSKMLIESRPPELSTPELTGEQSVGRLRTRNMRKSIAYDVYADSERYRIVSSGSTDRTRCLGQQKHG